MEDYYNKTRNNGIYFNDGIKAIPADNRYSTYIYAERAKQIISNHNETKPLFLYLPFQSVHAPIEVPKRFEDMYQHIVNDNRRKFSGMVSAMDEAIGYVTQALTDNGLIEDTLFIFTSDNGGWPIRGGNNYPLRGGKITIFEGGTRAAAFVSGSGIEKNGSTYEGLIHAVDWHPTILSAAGSSVDDIDDSIDGLDQWNAISTGAKSARNEFVYNLDDSFDPTTGHAAIRVGDFKLISGYPGPYQGWYKPEQELKGASAGFNSTWSGDGLYNLKDDPTEHNDLSKEHPDVVINLKAKLDEYRKAYVKPNDPKNDDKADPKYHGGHWMPGWC
jgi:arylsulfatase A-like enzyme